MISIFDLWLYEAAPCAVILLSSPTVASEFGVQPQPARDSISDDLAELESATALYVGRNLDGDIEIERVYARGSWCRARRFTVV
jgi:hypothetical protein